MGSEDKAAADTERKARTGTGPARGRNSYRKCGKRKSARERRSRGKNAAKSIESEKWESRSGHRVLQKEKQLLKEEHGKRRSRVRTSRLSRP